MRLLLTPLLLQLLVALLYCTHHGLAGTNFPSYRFLLFPCELFVQVRYDRILIAPPHRRPAPVDTPSHVPLGAAAAAAHGAAAHGVAHSATPTSSARRAFHMDSAATVTGCVSAAAAATSPARPIVRDSRMVRLNNPVTSVGARCGPPAIPAHPRGVAPATSPLAESTVPNKKAVKAEASALRSVACAGGGASAGSAGAASAAPTSTYGNETPVRAPPPTRAAAAVVAAAAAGAAGPAVERVVAATLATPPPSRVPKVMHFKVVGCELVGTKRIDAEPDGPEEKAVLPSDHFGVVARFRLCPVVATALLDQLSNQLSQPVSTSLCVTPAESPK